MMRVMIDACVLYPTLMRQIVLGAADRGFFAPFWSDRILSEWSHAAQKHNPGIAAVVSGEIVLVQSRWPDATVPFASDLEHSLHLPDPDDRHVLAAAITAQADCVLTLNAKDFPTRTLARSNVLRLDPDTMVFGFWQDHPQKIAAMVNENISAAQAAGAELGRRALLKRARLPKLAKALDQV